MRVSKNITLILMSPDKGTRRYSLRRGFALFMIWLAIGLPVLGGIGAYFGWDAWHSRQKWMDEKRELLLQLDRNRAEIERLAQTEKETRSQLLALKAAASEKPVRPEAAESYTTPVDKKIVRIEHPVFRQIDAQTLRLIMEMYNVMPPSPVNGRVLFSLRTADGKVYPLTHEDTGFRIIRFRKFVVQASLPAVPLKLTNASVMLEVLTEGTIIFRKGYPLLQKQ